MATNNFPNLAVGPLAQPIFGVLWTSPVTTWSASGSTVSWTVPTTVNGQTITKVAITDVTTRLISGTPGTSATYGLTISGNSPYTTRSLPTSGGGVDIGLMNLNVNNLSATYKLANPGDTVVFTSGGTFSNSTTWQFDILGFYVGLTTTGVASVLQVVNTTGTFSLGASGTNYLVTAATANTALVAAPAATLVEHHFVADAGNVLTINAVSGGVIRVGALGSCASSGNIVLTGPGAVSLIGIAGTNNFTLKGSFSGSVKIN